MFSAPILLIDDNVMLQACISRLLASVNHEPLLASSVDEGISVLLQRGPSVCMVLVDLRSPGVPGHELPQELRRRGYAALPPPLVLITGAQPAIPRGFQEVLNKPFTPDELRATVRRNCSFGGVSHSAR
jgi:CheY-like chemotaxis protein